MSAMLDIIEKSNPSLIKTACELHQRGEIPPDCYVVDLEVLRENTRQIKQAADDKGLRLYAMTKQINRNPSMLETIAASGIDKFVAVDIEGARAIHAQGLDVAHVGHLSQIPRYWMKEVLAMKPDVWTVYSYENAQFLSEAAVDSGLIQDILLKVIGPVDHAYPAQEGGIFSENVVDVARQIKELPGVRMVGTTGFPTISFDMLTVTLDPLPNITTVVDAATRIEDELGIEMSQINCPGTTSCASIDIIAEHGGTDGEPGAALWGMTPQQLFGSDVGKPGQVYVTEVSHYARDRMMVLGGGFYADSHDGAWAFSAGFVGSDPETIMRNRVRAGMPVAQWMDYYAWLYPTEGQRVKPGDSAVYFFRPQVFMTRSGHMATVEGVESGKPSVVAIYNKASERIK